MPFFSIIIPLFNKEKHIYNTINSVLNQSFSDFELIIVEDCSTDNSILEISKINDPTISIIKHKYNQGLSASRNTGIKNAKGGYIAFLDADDLWKPNFLEEIVNLIQEFPIASIFGTNYEEILVNSKVLLPSNIAHTLPTHSVIRDYFKTSLTQPLFCYSGVCVKKEIFESIGYFNDTITFGEDVDFNIRAHLKFQLAYSTKALVQYFVHVENQITQTNLGTKIITDFWYYEKNNPENLSLKKFLDFHRYTHAKIYKIEGNMLIYNKLTKEIKFSNLNWKQQILMFSPAFILKLIKKIKYQLLINGIRFTTYNK